MTKKRMSELNVTNALQPLPSERRPLIVRSVKGGVFPILPVTQKITYHEGSRFLRRKAFMCRVLRSIRAYLLRFPKLSPRQEKTAGPTPPTVID